MYIMIYIYIYHDIYIYVYIYILVFFLDIICICVLGVLGRTKHVSVNIYALNLFIEYSGEH